MLDLNNPVVRLCLDGTRAEYEGRQADSVACYWQAWQAAQDDFEACIAVHYAARFVQEPLENLRWNLEALSRADAVADERVKDFYPSLYLNVGHAYEVMGELEEARRFYDLAGRELP